MIVIDRDRVSDWVSERLPRCWGEGFKAIGLETGGRLVAGVIYEGWNGVSITTHIAIEGRMSKDFLYAIFHYPFVHVKARKIVCTIVESNRRCIKMVESMGFRKECQILDVHPDGSILVYVMDRKNCRFIGERYGNFGLKHTKQRSARRSAAAS